MEEEERRRRSRRRNRRKRRGGTFQNDTGAISARPYLACDAGDVRRKRVVASCKHDVEHRAHARGRVDAPLQPLDGVQVLLAFRKWRVVAHFGRARQHVLRAGPGHSSPFFLAQCDRVLLCSRWQHRGVFDLNVRNIEMSFRGIRSVESGALGWQLSCKGNDMNQVRKGEEEQRTEERRERREEERGERRERREERGE